MLPRQSADRRNVYGGTGQSWSRGRGSVSSICVEYSRVVLLVGLVEAEEMDSWVRDKVAIDGEPAVGERWENGEPVDGFLIVK